MLFVAIMGIYRFAIWWPSAMLNFRGPTVQ